MTTEYTPADIAMVLRCLRVQTEGPGPICPVCVHQAGLVAYDEQSGNRITAAGRLVLALAAERDLWRLKAEWQEAIVEQLRTEASVHETMADDGSFSTFTSKRNRLAFSVRKAEAARAAYVAAGGVV